MHLDATVWIELESTHDYHIMKWSTFTLIFNYLRAMLFENVENLLRS